MVLSFPQNPVLGQEYTVGVKTWKWNGYAWDLTTISDAQVLRAEEAADRAEVAAVGGFAAEKRGDVVSKNVIYRGDAAKGSSEGSAVWRIQKITIDYTNGIKIRSAWANNVKTYTNVWIDRATYIYQ